jgi:hypothetical protein
MLTAVDDRPKWSAPVNMISLSMQGGSPCENAPGLRVGTNNVEIAALTAPRPMLMVSATGDWTKNTPKEEYPGVKAFYDLYDKGADLETILIDAPHNYNRESREAVYRFFGKQVLKDPNAATWTEQRIRQEKLQDMMVFAGRALPENAVNSDQLFAYWVRMGKKQNVETVDPEVLRDRLTVALGTEPPSKVEHELRGENVVLGRPGAGDRVPGIWISGKRGATLIVHPAGAEAARNSAAAKSAIAAGRSVLLIDAFQTGSAVAPRDRSHQFFLTFNRSDDANRVQDIVTALSFLRQQGQQDITLVGLDKAAVWAQFAAAVSAVPLKLEADLGSFRGEDQDFIDGFFVPGIQRAGGLRAARTVTNAMTAGRR